MKKEESTSHINKYRKTTIETKPCAVNNVRFASLVEKRRTPFISLAQQKNVQHVTNTNAPSAWKENISRRSHKVNLNLKTNQTQTCVADSVRFALPVIRRSPPTTLMAKKRYASHA